MAHSCSRVAVAKSRRPPVRTSPETESNRWRRPMSSAASTKVARNDRAAANLPGVVACSRGARPFFGETRINAQHRCQTGWQRRSRGSAGVRKAACCRLPETAEAKTERVMLAHRLNSLAKVTNISHRRIASITGWVRHQSICPHRQVSPVSCRFMAQVRHRAANRVLGIVAGVPLLGGRSFRRVLSIVAVSAR